MPNFTAFQRVSRAMLNNSGMLEGVRTAEEARKMLVVVEKDVLLGTVPLIGNQRSIRRQSLHYSSRKHTRSDAKRSLMERNSNGVDLASGERSLFPC